MDIRLYEKLGVSAEELALLLAVSKSSVVKVEARHRSMPGNRSALWKFLEEKVKTPDAEKMLAQSNELSEAFLIKQRWEAHGKAIGLRGRLDRLKTDLAKMQSRFEKALKCITKLEQIEADHELPDPDRQHFSKWKELQLHEKKMILEDCGPDKQFPLKMKIAAAEAQFNLAMQQSA